MKKSFVALMIIMSFSSLASAYSVSPTGDFPLYGGSSHYEFFREPNEPPFWNGNIYLTNYYHSKGDDNFSFKITRNSFESNKLTATINIDTIINASNNGIGGDTALALMIFQGPEYDNIYNGNVNYNGVMSSTAKNFSDKIALQADVDYWVYYQYSANMFPDYDKFDVGLNYVDFNVSHLLNFTDLTADAAPVPEPSTFILLTAGLGGFALLRRKIKE